MTLTEKWKKGELKQGEYWCKITESPYVERVYLPCCDDIIVEVLEPVSSFEDAQKLRKENQQLRKWCEEFNALEVAEENKKLKELLKECRKALNKAKGDTVWYPVEIDHVLTQIDKAIGEKK